MELREYWHIIWSRRLMIGTLLLVTFVVSMGLTYGRPPTYETELRILVKPILPDAPDTGYYSREYYRTLYVVRITVSTPSSRNTKLIGEAAAEVLQTVGWQYVSPEDRPQVEVQVIDPPQEPQAPTILFRLLTVVLHVSVALAVGVALAFLLDTFDDRVRTADEVERDLGLAVLAAVPHGKPGDPASNRSGADRAADDDEQTTQ